jgi:hypothetical protein
MKIAICSSVAFTNKIKEVADELVKLGHEVEIPFSAQKILNGDISLESFLDIKDKEGDMQFRNSATEDLIKRYYNIIKNSDAILVINIDKNNIKNYIGGSVLMELGFAHVLEKKIYLLNPVPESSYRDEILAVKPIIINNNLNEIK